MSSGNNNAIVAVAVQPEKIEALATAIVRSDATRTEDERTLVSVGDLDVHILQVLPCRACARRSLQ